MGFVALYAPLAACQTSSLCATLDLLLMAASREDSLVVLGRQLVAHLRIVLRGTHGSHHLLAGRWSLMGVVLRHAVLGRRQRRAHGLLLAGRLRRRLLAVLQADGRQVERRQRHVGALGRASVGLIALLALGRGVGVGGLHRGRGIGMRRGIGDGLLLS